MSINQISSSNTFAQWLAATQALIENWNFVQNTANSVNTTANIVSSTSNSINILSNLVFMTSNSVNSRVDSVNTSANIVYTTANSINTSANITYMTSNSVNSIANIIFLTANSIYITSNNINNKSNSINVVANSVYNTSNNINTSFVYIANSVNLAFAQANSAYLTANGAFGRSNSAYLTANGAFDQANSAMITKANLSGAIFTGDICTYRSSANNTGVLYFGITQNRFLYYDGNQYNFSTANVVAPNFIGNLIGNASTSNNAVYATSAGSAPISIPASGAVGAYLLWYYDTNLTWPYLSPADYGYAGTWVNRGFLSIQNIVLSVRIA